MSYFRRQRLIDHLGVTDLRARYIHYVALHGAKDKETPNYSQEVLDQLLAYGDQTVDDGSDKDTKTVTLFVTPRV